MRVPKPPLLPLVSRTSTTPGKFILAEIFLVSGYVVLDSLVVERRVTISVPETSTVCKGCKTKFSQMSNQLDWQKETNFRLERQVNTVQSKL